MYSCLFKLCAILAINSVVNVLPDFFALLINFIFSFVGITAKIRDSLFLLRLIIVISIPFSNKKYASEQVLIYKLALINESYIEFCKRNIRKDYVSFIDFSN